VKNILVYGAGEFSDLIDNILYYSNDYKPAIYCDDDENKSGMEKYNGSVQSVIKALEEARRENVKHAIAAIGNNKIRAEKIDFLINNGFKIINVIHPLAMIDKDVKLGKGVIIEMGSAVHTKAVIGENVFIGGGAVIGHHNQIGDNVVIGGGCAFGGSVSIGSFTTVGVGVSIKPGIKIESNCIIGVGAAVVKNLPAGVIAAGVPAKILKNNI